MRVCKGCTRAVHPDREDTGHDVVFVDVIMDSRAPSCIPRFVKTAHGCILKSSSSRPHCKNPGHETMGTRVIIVSEALRHMPGMAVHRLF